MPEHRRVDTVETHVSTVSFVGERAYKRKKPVVLDFIDLSTRAAREAVCRREVELNRRLAPDVYLGVADVVAPDGAVVDHLVVMRRLPDGRRLSTLVRAGADVTECLDAVARLVAAFHARARTSPRIDDAGSAASVRERWDDCFATMAPFAGPVIDEAVLSRAQVLVHRYLDGRRALFARRIADGKIRDGHGDLLADDIFCLDDGPRVLDCIEFDDRLRHGDVLADVAFLAMDLERLGAPVAADAFVREYCELAGEQPVGTLTHHYVAERALVRSMVACLRWEQGDRRAAEPAVQLAEIAAAHLERGRVVLALVGGLPGTGKTTLADALADRLGWSVLHSDEVRKDVVGLGHAPRPPEALRQGIYDPVVTHATYEELLARARRLLELGEPVILDASWTSAALRSLARVMGEETASDVVALECTAPAEVAAARIEHRVATGAGASDATPDLAARLAVDADPWPDATPIDTSGSLDDALATALAATAVRP